MSQVAADMNEAADKMCNASNEFKEQVDRFVAAVRAFGEIVACQAENMQLASNGQSMAYGGGIICQCFETLR